MAYFQGSNFRRTAAGPSVTHYIRFLTNIRSYLPLNNTSKSIATQNDFQILSQAD